MNQKSARWLTALMLLLLAACQEVLHGVSGVSYDGKFYMLAGSNRANSASSFSRVIAFTPQDNE